MDLFGKKADISKIQLSDYKKPEKKIAQPKQDAKKEKRLNKTSSEPIPEFISEDVRLYHFPNKPKSLKELKALKGYKKEGKRWGNQVDWDKNDN